MTKKSRTQVRSKKRGTKKAATSKSKPKRASKSKPKPALKPKSKPTPPATRKKTPAKAATTATRSRAKPAPIDTAPSPYLFERVAATLPVGDLTPLRRTQLAIAIELGVGRRTSPDRLPAQYFELPDYTAVWHVLDNGIHRFDYVLNTLFFAGTNEPVGIEWIQGGFEATGRDATRGLELDLPRLAWDLQRAWPGRKLEPDPTAPDSTRFKPAGPGLRDLEWPADTTFV